MATHAIIVQWGNVVAGREQLAMSTFLAAVEYYGGLKAKRAVEDLRIYLSDLGNFGDQAGMLIVDGSEEQINKVLASSEHKTLLTKAYHLVDPLRVNVTVTGDEVPRRIELLNSVRRELGIV